MVGGEPGSPQTTEFNSQPDRSIAVQNSNQRVDLSNYGDPTPGTPIVIYGHWQGENQVWRFQQAN